MTTKSTPASTRRRSIALGSKAGHSAGRRLLGSIRGEGDAAERPCERVELLEPTETLVGRGAEVGRDHRFVDPIPGGEAKLKPAARCANDLLERVEAGV